MRIRIYHLMAAVVVITVMTLAGAALAAQGDCGQPASTGSGPTATDALVVLKTAVGSGACLDCICDVDGSGGITATDALNTLRIAVGHDVQRLCTTCDGSLDLPGETIVFVVASVGAILVTGDGIIVEIPPGALPADTMVSVIPVLPTEGRDVIAVRFEPDGLELTGEITVKMPLPADWPVGSQPEIIDFAATDPYVGWPRGEFAEVVNEGGKQMGVVPVTHFSGVTCALNCHAGMIRYIVEQLKARGCSRDDILGRVAAKFPTMPDVRKMDACGLASWEHAQALLDTYFDVWGKFETNVKLLPGDIDELSAFAREGRMVALTFGPGPLSSRSGPNNFFDDGSDLAHTAALEKIPVAGVTEVMIRNSLSVKVSALHPCPPLSLCAKYNTALSHLPESNKDRILYHLFSSINVLRDTRQGQLWEEAVCGEANCMWSHRDPPPVIALFQLPVDKRSLKWTASRVYVEKMSPEQWAGVLSGEPLPVPCGDDPPILTDSAMITYGDYNLPAVAGTRLLKGTCQVIFSPPTPCPNPAPALTRNVRYAIGASYYVPGEPFPDLAAIDFELDAVTGTPTCVSFDNSHADTEHPCDDPVHVALLSLSGVDSNITLSWPSDLRVWNVNLFERDFLPNTYHILRTAFDEPICDACELINELPPDPGP